jgi:mono/diheme cytochrome c family protein
VNVVSLYFWTVLSNKAASFHVKRFVCQKEGIMRLFYLFTSLMFAFLLAACGSSTSGGTAEPLPPGDSARGEELFTQTISGAPACSTCHMLDGSTLVGPSLQGYASVAGTRVEGKSAEDYTHESILRPPAHIVSGFSNVMYNQYERHLSSQQTADLIAYLLTL